MLPDNFLDEDFPSASAYGEYLRERILKVAHARGRWARLGELMGTPEEIMKKDAADWEGMLTFICGELAGKKQSLAESLYLRIEELQRENEKLRQTLKTIAAVAEGRTL